MKIYLRPTTLYLIIGLIVLVFLAYWMLGRSRDVNLLIINKEEATQVAVAYLAKKKITVEPTAADVIFLDGKWNVMFFVNPYERPAGILLRINPITGNAKIIPLQ